MCSGLAGFLVDSAGLEEGHGERRCLGWCCPAESLAVAAGGVIGGEASLGVSNLAWEKLGSNAFACFKLLNSTHLLWGFGLEFVGGSA